MLDKMDTTIASLSLDSGKAARTGAGIEQARHLARTGNEVQAREIAENFEAMFLSQMLQHMSSDIGEGVESMFGGGHSEGIFRSMLNDQYAEEITNRGGVGIADSVYREILKLQEV